MPPEIVNLGIVGVALMVIFAIVQVLGRIIQAFTAAVNRFTLTTEKWLAKIEDLQEDGRARDIRLGIIVDNQNEIRQHQAKQDLTLAVIQKLVEDTLIDVNDNGVQLLEKIRDVYIEAYKQRTPRDTQPIQTTTDTRDIEPPFYPGAFAT